MDASIRHAPGLRGRLVLHLSLSYTDPPLARIEKLRDELIKHFETLVGRAGVC